MINCEEITLEENLKLNNYINELNGRPKLVDCERLFEYLRIIRDKYGDSVRKITNKINLKIVKPAIAYIMRNSKFTTEYRNKAFELSKKVLYFSARDDFDSFLLYTEIDRPYTEKFWQPRKKSQMKKICEALQELADDELDVLFVACPPRVGKSTLGIWFDNWLAAKNASGQRHSILSVGHSASLVNTFYEESNNFCTGDKYKFFDVFPELMDKMQVSAKNQTINFGEERRYKSISFRSAESGLSGGVEADLLLHIDDLISGMEEALNPDRLEKKWQVLYGDIRQRRKEGAKILYIGTIWSMKDPQVRFRELLEEDPNFRIKIIELPALDENDESNFDYTGGFSTEHYRSERNGMDNVTWNCIYQQQPMERDGLLFSEDRFKTFKKEILNVFPIAKKSFCDVAWGGNDFVSMPILYKYEDGLYLADVVYNNSNKKITEPIIAQKIIKHKLYECPFEKNNGGGEYADDIKNLLKEQRYICRVVARQSPNTANAKLQRIIQYSPEIQDIHILEKKDRTPEYQKFINSLLTFNQNGKNKNDDGPDSLALLFMYDANKPKEVKILPKNYKIC